MAEGIGVRFAMQYHIIPDPAPLAFYLCLCGREFYGQNPDIYHRFLEHQRGCGAVDGDTCIYW